MSGAALEALEAAAAQRIGSRGYDEGLAWIAQQCAAYRADTQRLGQIAGSRRLDALCLAIGAEWRWAGGAPSPAPHGRRYVYLVTMLYRDGGHTRILEDLIAAHPTDEHEIVWTDPASADAAGPLGDVLRIEHPPRVTVLRGSPTEKLRAGFALVDRLAPDAMIHLGHPDDPLTLALLQPAPARQRVVFHHADFSFALGRFVPGALHVSAGHHFQRMARDQWGLETAYLPLTSRAVLPPLRPRPAGAFTTATAGSRFKFGLDGETSYLDVLSARFGARSGRHVHFGELEPEQLRRIEEHLSGAGWLDRFCHVGYVPSLASALVETGASLYVDSYPVGGAKTIVEAMAAGLPVCAASYDPSLDGSSFTYPESLRWTRPAELRSLLAGLDDAALAAQADASRAYFARHHAFPVFAARFDDLLWPSDPELRRPGRT